MCHHTHDPTRLPRGCFKMQATLLYSENAEYGQVERLEIAKFHNENCQDDMVHQCHHRR